MHSLNRSRFPIDSSDGLLSGLPQWAWVTAWFNHHYGRQTQLQLPHDVRLPKPSRQPAARHSNTILYGELKHGLCANGDPALMCCVRQV